MKTIISLAVLTLTMTLCVMAADVKVIAINGTVSVRHGVSENWNRVVVGDILKPEDTINLEEKSTVVLLIDGTKRITLPENTMMEVSDLRILSQEEVLLRLAIENIRSIPPRNNLNMPGIPRTTTVYGTDKENKIPESRITSGEGLKQLKGTRVLFEYGYYGTCALRTKEVTRLFPDLPNSIDSRLRAATALEKIDLKLEALEEYISIGKEELTPDQRSLVTQKIKELREWQEKN